MAISGGSGGGHSHSQSSEGEKGTERGTERGDGDETIAFPFGKLGHDGVVVLTLSFHPHTSLTLSLTHSLIVSVVSEHPYPQQVQLMKAIVSTIRKGNIGLFESPTGTGKSLSVICSVMHWLHAEERKILQDIMDKAEESLNGLPASTANSSIATSSTGIDWLDDFIVSNSEDKEKNRQQRDAVEVREALLQRIRRKKTLKPLPLHHRGRRHLMGLTEEKVSENENDDELLCHYDSDDEVPRGVNNGVKLDVGYDSGSDTECSISPHHAKEIPVDDKKRVDLDPLISYVDSQLHMPKIFYCSRTHSQLAQFVSEIKKATGGSASTVKCITLGSRSNMCINPTVNSMGSDVAMSEKCLDMQKSKQKLSVSTVDVDYSGRGDQKRLRGLNRGDDPVSMKKSSSSNNKSSTCKCEFHSVSAEQHFVEHAMGEVRDIEDLVVLGQAVHACPYYASRKAITQAQVVCLPYNLMLSKQSRATLGISLKHNVVVFDEAHNIVEAANMVHSAEVTHSHLKVTSSTLKTYLSRFRNVLNGKNFYYLNLLISMAQSFQKLILKVSSRSNASEEETNLGQRGSTSSPNPSNVYTVNDFVFLSAIDNVNLRKIARYVDVTHLVRKVGGFVDNEIRRVKESMKEEESSKSQLKSKAGGKGGVPVNKSKKSNQISSKLDPVLLSMASSATQSLRAFFGLLTALQNSDADGRIFVSPRSMPSGGNAGNNVVDETSFSIQYVLLNPSTHFSDIVDQSRSVLFLGGTLQPFDYLVSSLFPQCAYSAGMEKGGTVIVPVQPKHPTELKSVDRFSCSHIIPSTHISTYAVRTGPSNVQLDFRHGNRDKDVLVRELFWAVYRICAAVPHGVVLFFTSYAYMECVVAAWKRMLLTPQLGAIKHICVEQRKVTPVDCNSKSISDSTDAWAKYCNCIQESTNHPSSKGAILLSVMGGKLSEGINFSDDLARAVVIVGMPYPDLSDPVLKEKLSFADRIKKGNSRVIYEGMCMKSVNQSIGRAIRHIGDHASVVLLDHRYTLPRVKCQLPSWILKSTNNDREIFHSFTSFQDTISDINSFFANK